MLRLRLCCSLFLLAVLAVGCSDFNTTSPSRTGLGQRCVPAGCRDEGVECGVVDDGCGGFLHCGTCQPPLTCGGAGNPIRCGCTPDCSAPDLCGEPDGCGGSCPTDCPTGLECGIGAAPCRCTCRRDCADKCAGPDGCGGVCFAECPGIYSCGGDSAQPFACGCTPQCGGKCDGSDLCGGACPDTCVFPETCASNGVCGCTPKCGGKCDGPDACLGICPDTCAGLETCGGGGRGTEHTCGCVVRSCAELLATSGLACGDFPNCGTSGFCMGACGGADVCDTRDATCCTPNCGGPCGPDGCGGDCGTCATGTLCEAIATGFGCIAPAPACIGRWCFVFPQPAGGRLNAVWAPSPAEVWIAGDDGLLLHHDSNGFQRIATPSDADLNGVFGRDADHVWVVGDAGTVLAYDTGVWSVPVPTSTRDLNDVWVDPLTGDAFAAASGGTLVEVSRSMWSEITTPVTDELLAVWGFAGGELWAAGRGGAVVRSSDRASFTAVDTGTSVPLLDLWGTSPSDMWATGAAGGGPLHWQGGGWVSTLTAARYDQLRVPAVDGFVAIVGDGTDLWAASLTAGTGGIWRWSGSVWLEDHAPGRAYTGLFAGGGRAFAVGERGTVLFGADGWVLGSESPPAQRWGSVDAHGSGAGDVWMLDAAAEAWHWDGSRWTIEALPSITPTGIWVGSANDVWVVGRNEDGFGGQVILHRDAVGWSTVHADPAAAPLNDIWGNTASDIWVVGDGGTLLRGDAGGFAPPTDLPATTIDFHGIAGKNQNTVWIVGGRQIWHWDGAEWSADLVDTGGPVLYGVWAASFSEAWAVGEGDQAAGDRAWHTTNRRTWSPVPLPLTGGTLTLRSVFGTSASDVIAVGEARSATVARPVVVRWDGAAWTSEVTGAKQAARGVFATGSTFAGDLRVWVGARDGVFVRGP